SLISSNHQLRRVISRRLLVFAMRLALSERPAIIRCLLSDFKSCDFAYFIFCWASGVSGDMRIQMRSLQGCGLAPTQERRLVVPASIPILKTLTTTPLQHLRATTLSPDRRRQRNTWLAAHKSDLSFSTTTRPKRSSTGKEGSVPLPAHADDILLVPSAHLHVKQLERHDVFTLSDFHRAYNKEKANFRRFLQDKIEVRDEEQLTAMEAFFRAMEDFQATSTSAGPAGANQAWPEARVGPQAEAAAGPVKPIAALGMTTEQVTLSVEGNISAGKSTFLSILKRHLLMDKGFSFVKEPIEQWQNVGGSSVNLLDLFYRDPARMAYTFQNFVFLTRVLQERETYGSTAKARILERSVFSDRMVFVRAAYASRDLADHELAIYDAWFGPILASLPTLVPNGLIYLRASPETCMARLKKRARSEEGGIPIAYLQCLHTNHEDWLLHAAMRACELKQHLQQQHQGEEARAVTAARQRSAHEASTSCSADSDVDLTDIGRQQRERQRLPSLSALRPLAEAPPEALGLVEIPDSLADTLHIIDATKVSGVPSAGFLHQLPTLVVDCDTDVDVDRDMAYGNKISNLIRDYTTFVSQYRAACHRLAAERRATAASEWGSGLGLDAAVRALPHRDTEYYTTDDFGRVTYRSIRPDVPGGVAMGAAEEAATLAAQPLTSSSG
ncbi:hypothetical protein Vretimale_11762, partial [Volvox reticuliferus]